MIRLYSNRRLYDMELHRNVTHDELINRILAGESPRIEKFRLPRRGKRASAANDPKDVTVDVYATLLLKVIGREGFTTTRLLRWIRRLSNSQATKATTLPVEEPPAAESPPAEAPYHEKTAEIA